MRNWFQKIKYRIARMMYGRYGNDELNIVLLVLALVLSVVGSLPVPYLWLSSVVGLIVLCWTFFRTFSRNIVKRRRELEFYLKIKNKPKNARKLRKNKKRDKKTHVYFKCPKCRAVLRVPRGKGDIIVTCPRCNERIEKRT